MTETIAAERAAPADVEAPVSPATRGPNYEKAVLGLRHYWYPALLSRDLGRKPKSVTMLGQKLVLVRAFGKPYALYDQCVHRGMLLSAGECFAEGTITCPYHGWTFDVTDGSLVAALTDGPESAVVGKRGKQVRAFPTEERGGTIYVYMGDATPPPLDDDVPEELLGSKRYVKGVVVNSWNCNWRAAVENGHDAAHAPMVHRKSLRWRTGTARQPAWCGHVDNVLEGKYLFRRAREIGGPAVYPRIGLWPRQSWLRRQLAKRGRRQFQSNAFRLPSMICNAYPTYQMVRWVVPVDATSCRNFMWLTGQARGFARLKWLAMYWLWHRWVFTKLFTRQDQRIVERLDYAAPEQFFRPDSSIVGLRKYIEANARRADP